MDGLTHLFWRVLSEYISNKDSEAAAHHLVSELIDHGAEETALWDMCKGNPLLRKAVKNELGELEDIDLDEDDDE